MLRKWRQNKDFFSVSNPYWPNNIGSFYSIFSFVFRLWIDFFQRKIHIHLRILWATRNTILSSSIIHLKKLKGCRSQANSVKNEGNHTNSTDFSLQIIVILTQTTVLISNYLTLTVDDPLSPETWTQWVTQRANITLSRKCKNNSQLFNEVSVWRFPIPQPFNGEFNSCTGIEEVTIKT